MVAAPRLTHKVMGSMALVARDTALVTATDAALSLLGKTTADEGLITQLIEFASGWVSDRCGRKFLLDESDRTELYDGDGQSDTLYLDGWPIVSIASVHVNSSGLFDSTALLTRQLAGTAGNYVAYTSERDLGKLRYVGASWPFGLQNIQVKYKAGYTDGSIPAPIRRAVLKIVQSEFGRIKQGLTSLQSASMPGGGGNVSVSTTLEDELEPILRPFTRPALVA